MTAAWQTAAQLAAGWLVVAIAMVAAWLWQRRTRNASVVDVVWTFCTGGLAVYYACVATGPASRRMLVGLLFAGWAVRLGLHLVPRLLHRQEDRRYEQMRAGWGAAADWRFLLFFQTQALVAPLFAAVAWIAGQAPGPLSWLDALGATIAAGGIAGEWIADYQLARFRANQDNEQVCDRGLWRYTRHPNYFFEWLFWCGLVGLTLSSPWWWLALGPPLAMYYFLNYVTGIPPAEAQAVARRGALYRDYQRRTSAFFPWLPGKS